MWLSDSSRGVCPGATAASEWENMAETFVDSIDHGLRHNLLYAMADADDPQLLSATLAFALHGRPAACPTATTSSLQHSCGSDFGGVFAAVARRKPDVALEFLRANWAEAGSVSRLNLVAEVNCCYNLDAHQPLFFLRPFLFLLHPPLLENGSDALPSVCCLPVHEFTIVQYRYVRQSCATTLQVDAIAAVASAVGVDGTAAVAKARANAAWRDTNGQEMCDWLRTEAAGL